MSGERDLERRQREILAAIVRQYVSSGVPVGSKAVVEQLPEALSSATVRSVMAELEESGYLAQPHVSAGRVPTDQAYRFYVDRIAGTTPLAADVENYILVSLGAAPDGPHGDGPEAETAETPEPSELLMQQLLTRVSHVLAEVSHNVGLVLGPAPEDKILEHVKFVKLPERRILAVIVSKPDLVENNVVRPREEFSQEELDRAAEYLNAEFRGWSLAAIRVEIFKRLEEMKQVCDHLVTSVGSLFASGALASDETGALFVGGATTILEQPEFEDASRVRDLLATFEEKAKLVRILNGRENSASEMQECTLIVAPFHYRRQMVGALGIVGPTRMEYDRAITAVDYIAHLCSKLLSSN